MHRRVLKFGIWWIQKLCSFIKKKIKIVELETEERKITAQLSLVKANKRSTNKETKWLETELENIKNRKEHPLSVNDVLEDNVVSSAFPSIRYLLKLFVLVPMSEAVVEREFSKMKLTLTDKRTRLDNKSLDALRRMSFDNVTLVPEAVQQIVETWKRQCQRRIFSEDI